MSLNVLIDGDPILEGIPPTSLTPTQRADSGEVGFGGFVIEDPSALVTTTGHRSLVIEETECSQPRLFTGYLTDRNIGRSADEAMIAGDDARLHSVEAVDLNAVFGLRIISGTDGNRPRETWTARMTWLLGSAYLSGLIEDTGNVPAYTLMMDAADYRDGYPKAVIDDLIERKSDTPLHYFAYWDTSASAVGLFVGTLATGNIGTSTLSISNDLSEVDSDTVFAPSKDTTLRRSPETVYSEVVVQYGAGSRVYRKRQSTADAYIARGTTITRPYTKSATTAQSQAERFLSAHDSEEDRISTAIVVPASKAGLITPGMLVPCHFTNLPDYESDWTDLRVAEITPTPTSDVANYYELRMELVAPRASSAIGANVCDTNSALGIEPTANTNVPADLYGAGGEGDVIHQPETATDDDLPESPSDTDGAYYRSGVWQDAETLVYREWVITLPAEGSISAVTVQAWYYGSDLGNHLSKAYVKVGSTKFDSSYATLNDTNDWPLFEAYGNPDSFATWTFPATISDTVTFGFEKLTANLEYVPYCSVHEITFCVTDLDEEVDVGVVPPPPVLSTGDPTADDDEADGYAVGQEWTNTSTGQQFVLIDATEGAAVWIAVPRELDDLADVNAAAPDDGDVLTWDDGAGEWIASAGASGSVALDSIWDAKGDLAVGTGSNTATRLAVGTDGYVLTASASETTGLVWAASSGSGGYPLDNEYSLDATYGDNFNGSNLKSIWTRRNYTSGAETYQTGANQSMLRIAKTGRTNGDGYFQTAPSGDWTFAMRFIPRFWGAATGLAWGIGVVDTAGTGVATCFYSNPNALLLASVTTYSTYGSTYVQPGGSGTNPNVSIFGAYQWKETPTWIYLRKSGTSYYCAYSLDGEVWSPESSGITWTGTVDRIAMMDGPLGSAGYLTASVIEVDWFNKIA